MPEQQARRDPAAALQRLIDIVDALRTECGWTARLTPESLAPYLVEEAAEVSETVRHGDLGAHLASELGDVLFQILLHARLGEERGDLDLTDVIQALTDKLLRRNTHVFAPDGSVLDHPDHDPEAAERAWQQAKAQERAARGEDASSQAADPLRGLPRSLPALVLAQKALSRAAALSQRTMPDDAVPGRGAAGASAPSTGVTEHEREHEASGTDDQDVIGNELLSLVQRARTAGVDAESALRNALERVL
ncbi:MAG: MazG nucleotide pyrophosphohydrolase domain-containing protein [Galactobacter sp.]